MCFCSTKWKGFVTLRLRECWRSRRRLPRTRCSRRRKICAECWSRRGTRKVCVEKDPESELQGYRTDFYGWQLRGMGRAGATRDDLLGLRGRGPWLASLERGIARIARG